jgi:hypothetical protein
MWLRVASIAPGYAFNALGLVEPEIIQGDPSLLQDDLQLLQE